MLQTVIINILSKVSLLKLSLHQSYARWIYAVKALKIYVMQFNSITQSIWWPVSVCSNHNQYETKIFNVTTVTYFAQAHLFRLDTYSSSRDILRWMTWMMAIDGPSWDLNSRSLACKASALPLDIKHTFFKIQDISRQIKGKKL